MAHPARDSTAIKSAFLDELVTEAVIIRLERPDALQLLESTDSTRDDERAALRQEIERRRAWLEQVRERARRERNLDLLFDQERRTQPLIEAAQRVSIGWRRPTLRCSI